MLPKVMFWRSVCFNFKSGKQILVFLWGLEVQVAIRILLQILDYSKCFIFF